MCWRKKINRALNFSFKEGELFRDSPHPTGFKIRDLMDINNLTADITNIKREDKFIDVSKGSDGLEALRVLMIVNFARYGGDPSGKDLSVFLPTPESREAFRAEVKGKACDLYQMRDDRIDEILGAFHKIIGDIFPSFAISGLIEIEEKEKQFLNLLKGCDKMPSGQLGPARADILVKNLKELHPKAFEAYPELESRIENHPTLKQKVLNLSQRSFI